MKRLIPLALPLVLLGCATTPFVDPDPTARLGETARIGGLRIRPLRIVEDSRCPINARCVWAGRIVVLTEVGGAAGHSTHSLSLGEPVNHGGGRLGLVAAEPGRTAGVQTPPAAYEFTFEFTPLR